MFDSVGLAILVGIALGCLVAVILSAKFPAAGAALAFVAAAVATNGLAQIDAVKKAVRCEGVKTDFGEFTIIATDCGAQFSAVAVGYIAAAVTVVVVSWVQSN